ncbi:hypothetical protein VRU48_07650 [Pedobacter sp. KR3-3]|uniref:Uncharacterized protein n=1 Tax=Pedobacter albus TaxID=3113905 RepID=A0ABU7I671_9SPHI|nr:hypothetical protein [Pedobacter sp. KR3-3]MEE1944975.1 hypothetical protein [Pedobacter sp. KR3-3]
MKTLISKSFLIALFLIALQANAQVKKVPVKKTVASTKAKSANTAQASSKNMALALLGINVEQASRLISNELKAIGIQIESIGEEAIYDEVKNGKQTGKLLQNRTSLVCNNRTQIDLIADPNNVVLHVNWFLNDVLHDDYIKIERLLGYQKWPVITKSEEFSSYLNNNLIANVNYFGSSENDATKLTYAIHLSKTDRFNAVILPSPFIIDSITVHDNAEETGQNVVQFLKSQGLKFLYKSTREILINMEGDGLASAASYATTYMFAEGMHVNILTNKYQQLDEINFYFTDPLVHHKIKRLFNLGSWTKENEGDNEDDIVYRKDHLECTNNDREKSIAFTIAPFINDIETRYQNTTPMAASAFISYYFNMEKDKLKSYLAKNYVNMADVSWKSRKLTYRANANPFHVFFKSPADSLCFAAYEYDLSDTKSRIAYFSTGDQAYLEKMKAEIMELEKDKKSKFIATYSEKSSATSGMNYIMIFSKAQEAILTENKRKQADAEQAQKQREKELAAEQERLKAEKAAKTAADIQKVGDILIQGIQQMKKKGNN